MLLTASWFFNSAFLQNKDITLYTSEWFVLDLMYKIYSFSQKVWYFLMSFILLCFKFITTPSYIFWFNWLSNGKILGCILHFFSPAVQHFVRNLILVTECYRQKEKVIWFNLILKLNSKLKLSFMSHATILNCMKYIMCLKEEL